MRSWTQAEVAALAVATVFRFFADGATHFP